VTWGRYKGFNSTDQTKIDDWLEQTAALSRNTDTASQQVTPCHAVPTCRLCAMVLCLL